MNQSTYNFVVATKRDAYFRQREKEINMLLDPATGKIKAEYAQPVRACFICGDENRTKVFTRQGFDFHHCDGCGFIYADPQVIEEKLLNLYRESSANDLWIEVMLSADNMNYDRKKYTTGLARIESVCGGKGRLLDIGCSIGLFPKIAGESGWQAQGLELNEKAVAHARGEWGLDIKKKLLHEAGYRDAEFDAVTLWGVVEHLTDPVSVLREANRVVRPGGCVLLFCPNIESLVARVLHENTSCVDGRNHCGYYSPETITLLLDRCGFQMTAVESYQPELDTILNYLNFDDPYLKETQGKNPIKEYLNPPLSELLDNMILDSKLGYKMMTIARKR